MLISHLSQDPDIQEIMEELRSELKTLAAEEDIKQFWKDRCYYPLIRDQCCPAFSMNLQEVARGLMEDLDAQKKRIGIRFQNALRENMDLYVRFIVEVLVDEAWNRNVGEPESISLTKLLKPVADGCFREFYHRICFVKSEKLANMCALAKFQKEPEDDGVILYGYIDRSHGLSFIAICCAHIDASGSIACAPVGQNIFLRISADSIKDTRFFDLMESNCDTYEFNTFIERAMCFEDNNLQIELMRQNRGLDSMRHPEYPDDIRVLLYKENLQPEQVWVRGIGAINSDGYWLGRLLNEPYEDYGCHNGEEIVFRCVAEDGSEPICYFVCNGAS